MGFKFPYGNSQQLNLNWFIKKFKELLVDWQHEKESIDGALDAEIQRAEDALSDVYTARDTTIAAKNDALQAKADALTAAANAAQYWQNAAASANSAATSAVTALQAAQDAADNADQTSRDRALVTADKAAVAADKAAVAADKAAVAADKAAVEQDKDDVDTLKDAANAAALRSEGWADGTQNGTPVTSGSPYYQNNSKYFKEEAEAVLESIPEDYTELVAEVAAQGDNINVLIDTFDSVQMLDWKTIGTKYSVTTSGHHIFRELNHIKTGDTGTTTTGKYTYNLFGGNISIVSNSTALNTCFINSAKLAIPSNIDSTTDIVVTIREKWQARVSGNRRPPYIYIGTVAEDNTVSRINIEWTSTSHEGDYLKSISLRRQLPAAITNKNLVFVLGPNNAECLTDIWFDVHAISIYETTTIKNMIAPVTTSYIAPSNMVSGDLIIVNNTLYKATTAIASGATLTVGTNITATKLTTELKAIRES